MVKRLEITVPTNAPFNEKTPPPIEYWKEKKKKYIHGCWVEEVVQTLMNKDDDAMKPDARGRRAQAPIDFTEEYHRYPARDGIEYSRIHHAFREIDV